jgi:hypothetical protein
MKRQEMQLTGLRDLLRGSTYVEVRLVRKGEKGEKEQVWVKTTSTSDGNFPDWNETLLFDLFAANKNHFSP